MATQDTYFQDIFEKDEESPRESFDALISTRKRQAPEDLIQPFDRERASREPAYLPAGATRPPRTTFANAFEAGARGLGANRKFFGALFRDARGERATASTLIEQGKELQQEASLALSGEPTFEEFFNEPTVGGFLKQFILATGQFTPSAASSIAGAFAGGGTFALARMSLGSLATKLGMRKAAKDIAAKKIGGEALDKAEQKFLQDYYDVIRGKFVKNSGEVVYNPGFLGGAGAQEYIQGTGILYSEFAAQGMRDENARMRARGGGLGYAAIGVAGEAALFTSFKRLATYKNPSKTLKRQLAKDVLFKGGLLGLLSEGGAEGLQEEISIQQKFRIDPDYTKAEAKLERLQAYFYGAIGGFGLGAAGGSAASISRIARTQFVEAAHNTDLFKGIKEDTEEELDLQERTGITEPYVMAVADKEGKLITGIAHNGTPESMEAAEAELKRQIPDIGTPESPYTFYQDRAEARNADGTLKPMSTKEYVSTMLKQEGLKAEDIQNFMDEMSDEPTGVLPLDELGNPIGLTLVPRSMSFVTKPVTELVQKKGEGWAKDRTLAFTATANPNIQIDRKAFDERMQGREALFTEEDLAQWRDIMTDRIDQAVGWQIEVEGAETVAEYMQRYTEEAKKAEKLLSLLNESHIGQPKKKVYSYVNDQNLIEDEDERFKSLDQRERKGEYEVLEKLSYTPPTDRNRPITEADLVAINSILEEGSFPYGKKGQAYAKKFGNELLGKPLYSLFSDSLMKRVEELSQEKPGSEFTIHLETDQDNEGYGKFKVFEMATIDEIRFTTTVERMNAGIQEAIASEKRRRYAASGRAEAGYNAKGGSGWYLVPRESEEGTFSEGVLEKFAKNYKDNGRIPIDMSRLTVRGAQINRLQGNLLDNLEEDQVKRWNAHMADGFFTALVELDKLGYDLHAAIHEYKWKEGNIEKIKSTKYASVTDPLFYRQEAVEEETPVVETAMIQDDEFKTSIKLRNRLNSLVVYESGKKGTKEYEVERAELNYLNIKDPSQRRARAKYDVNKRPLKVIRVKNIIRKYEEDYALVGEIRNIKKRQSQLGKFLDKVAWRPGAPEAPTVFLKATKAEKAQGIKDRRLYTEELIQRDIKRLPQLQEELQQRQEKRRIDETIQDEVSEVLRSNKDYVHGRFDQDAERAEYETSMSGISYDERTGEFYEVATRENLLPEVEQALEERLDKIGEGQTRAGSRLDAELANNELIRDLGGMGLSSSQRIADILNSPKTLKKNIEGNKKRARVKRDEELSKLSLSALRARNQALHRKLIAEAKAKEESEEAKKTEPPTEAVHIPGAFKNLSKKFDQFAKIISNNKLTLKTAGREVVWFGAVDYAYTGARHQRQDMPKQFSNLARQIEKQLGYPEGYFNSVLSNLFPAGKIIGPHSDNENIFVREDKTIGAVATISLGGTSDITITDTITREIENVFTVNDGDLYVMPDGTFQVDKKHAVGPSKGKRISMTFRHIASSKLPAPAPSPAAPAAAPAAPAPVAPQPRGMEQEYGETEASISAEYAEYMQEQETQKRKQELIPNTFFSPSIQRYFRKTPFLSAKVSGPPVVEKMARLARTAFKIDSNIEIVVIDQKENLNNNPKINAAERTHVEGIRKKWVEETTKRGNVVTSGDKRIIMLRTSAKPSPTEYIKNVFVFGHELGHILFKQEWAKMSREQKDRMTKAWEKAKEHPNASKQWSAENGLEEWAADRMSRFLFDETLKAKTAADTMFKKFAKLLRHAFKQLHSAFRTRFGQEESVGYDFFEEWAGGVVQAYKDGTREATKRGEISASQEIEIQNMIDDTVKDMTPSDKKKYSDLISQLMRYMKGNVKNTPTLLKAIFKPSDNFIFGTGKDKQSIKNFKKQFPHLSKSFKTAMEPLAKMLYGASQSLDRVGFSNIIQRKKRIYSKDKLGKLVSYNEKERVAFLTEAETSVPTFVMEPVPLSPSLAYMQQHRETLFIINETVANDLKIPLKAIPADSGPRQAAQLRMQGNIVIVPPMVWLKKPGFTHEWLSFVKNKALRDYAYTTATTKSLPSALFKRLDNRIKLVREIPVRDARRRDSTIKQINNSELVEVLRDSENPNHNDFFVPNIGIGEGQLSEGAFGARSLYRFFHGAENLGFHGVRLANDFMARMLNVTELGESSVLRRALSNLIVKWNKGRTHHRLIQSPYPEVSNEQLYEAYKKGKKKITIKGKEYKVKQDLGVITGYFEVIARDEKGEIIYEDILVARADRGRKTKPAKGIPKKQYWEKFQVNKELADTIVAQIVVKPDQATIDLALSEEEYFNTDEGVNVIDAKDLSIGLLPHRSKIFSFIPTAELRKAGVLVDPDITVDRYIANTVKKVEWEKRGGWKKASALIKTLDNDFERRLVRTAVKNTLGKYDVDMSSAFRAINSWGLFINISTLLAFAVFASFPDLAGPVLRSKEWRALKVAGQTLFEMARNPQEAAQLAEEIGIATREAMDNMYIHSIDADWMLDTPRAWSDKFFKWTLTEGYTRFMRQFASSMGKKFLTYHAEQAKQGNKRSIRYLAELDGLHWTQVKEWEGAGYSFSGNNGQTIQLALGRFVEESVIRPNASERPFYASDPRFALIWQLKAFFYAYGKNIVGGVAREAISRRKETGNVGAMIPPLMLYATTVLPLTMLGWDMRERAKYGLALGLPFVEPSPSKLNDMDWGQYSFEVLDRSGVLGPWTILAQMRQNQLWGDSLITPLLGPSSEKLEDILTQGTRYNLTNLVPIYSQLPKRRKSSQLPKRED